MDAVKVSQQLRDLRNKCDNGKSISTKTLAELLNERCEEKGIKGISEQTLKDYERPAKNGTTENVTKGTAILGMRIEYLDLLADFYGVSTDYILDRSPYKTPNVNQKAACAYTGLSEPSAAFLHKENRHNPMYWRMDMVNYLLEHPVFPFLLDFLIGFSLSEGRSLKDVPETNGTIPAVTDRDIFKTKITELISEIAEDSIGFFENRPDRRKLYEAFYRISFSKKFKEKFTLDDMKKEMEANSLIFNAEMFQDAERDGE